MFMVISSLTYSITASELYNKVGLSNKMDFVVFERALKGYSKIAPTRPYRYLTIIDFTKPSTKPRFSVIDMQEQKLCVYTYVAHGKNSGYTYATSFSNVPNSYQSSLGFFITDAKPYMGDFGYAIRLIGLENEFNSNAFKRDIVIHGENDINEDYIRKNGFLARTLGCPAVPANLSKPIIDLIANNTLIFAASNDSKYIHQSQFLN